MSQFLSGPVQVAAQTLRSSSADKYHNYGELVFANDGRAYRYARAGELLVTGTLLQSAAEDTDTENLAVAAAAIGATSVVTTTTGTVTANEYAEGFLAVAVTPGIGDLYKVKGHIAYTTAAMTFDLFDSIRVALTTSSRIDVVANPLNGVIINPASATGAPVGVAVHAIASGEYGWVQVGGVANILNDAGSTVGTNVSASNATAGAVEAAVTAQAAIGVALTGISTTENGLVRLFGLL